MSIPSDPWSRISPRQPISRWKGKGRASNDQIEDWRQREWEQQLYQVGDTPMIDYAPSRYEPPRHRHAQGSSSSLTTPFPRDESTSSVQTYGSTRQQYEELRRTREHSTTPECEDTLGFASDASAPIPRPSLSRRPKTPFAAAVRDVPIRNSQVEANTLSSSRDPRGSVHPDGTIESSDTFSLESASDHDLTRIIKSSPAHSARKRPRLPGSESFEAASRPGLPPGGSSSRVVAAGSSMKKPMEVIELSSTDSERSSAIKNTATSALQRPAEVASSSTVSSRTTSAPAPIISPRDLVIEAAPIRHRAVIRPSSNSTVADSMSVQTELSALASVSAPLPSTTMASVSQNALRAGSSLSSFISKDRLAEFDRDVSHSNDAGGSEALPKRLARQSRPLLNQAGETTLEPLPSPALTSHDNRSASPNELKAASKSQRQSHFTVDINSLPTPPTSRSSIGSIVERATSESELRPIKRVRATTLLQGKSSYDRLSVTGITPKTTPKTPSGSSDYSPIGVPLKTTRAATKAKQSQEQVDQAAEDPQNTPVMATKRSAASLLSKYALREHRVDPELLIAKAHWSRRFEFEISSFVINGFSSKGNSDRILRIKLKFVADVVGKHEILESIADSIALVPTKTERGSRRLVMKRSSRHFQFDLHPQFYRNARDLCIELSVSFGDHAESQLNQFIPVSVSDGPKGSVRIIPSALEQRARLDSETTMIFSWKSGVVMDQRVLSVEDSAEELRHRIERMRLELSPAWLPDAKSEAAELMAKAKKKNGFKALTKSPGDLTVDFSTKRPLDANKRMMEPYTIETPQNTLHVRQAFDARLLQTNYTSKERLVLRLHHSWTLLNPFPISIFHRETSCWVHFASVIHHFKAFAEMSWYLWTSQVVNDRNEMRKLLSVREWKSVLQRVKEEMELVEEGKRETYEQWRTRAISEEAVMRGIVVA